MFAPSSSRPPYYPSYLPPDAQELGSLFKHATYLPEHGMGAWNETWKIQHGVYLSEEKEADMKSSEIQRTTASLQKMKGLMASAKNASQKLAQTEQTIANTDPNV